PVRVTVELDRKRPQLLARFDGAELGDLRGLIASVRDLFDLDHNPALPRGAGGPRALKGMRVPGAFSPFETAVRIVLGQLVSVEASRTKVRALVENFGDAVESGFDGLTHAFPTAEALAEADLMKPLGLTRVRANAINALAEAVRDGDIVL